MLPLGGWRLSGAPLVLAPLTLAALVLEGRTPSAPRPGPRDRVILDDGFESGLSAWAQIPDSGRYTISTDPARIHSGTHSLQALYTPTRSEEHTSELQSLRHLVCRLLLEKKKKNT